MPNYSVIFLLQCLEIQFELSLFLICCLTEFSLSLNAQQALAMGGSKSKSKDVGQRTRSLDGNLSSGGGAGGHHLNSTQQSLTPNRSPTVDAGLSGNQSMANTAELTLFGGVDNNSVTSSNCIARAGENLRWELSVLQLPPCCAGYLNCALCMLHFIKTHTLSSHRRGDDLCGIIRLWISNSHRSVF